MGLTRAPSTDRLSSVEALRHIARDRDAIREGRKQADLWRALGGVPTDEERRAFRNAADLDEALFVLRSRGRNV
jgi:hypothetical protein